MIRRIVEIADDRRHLFVNRGFMVVRDTEGERKELGQVPLDDIAAVIANAHGISYTNNLLVALAERGAPFVLCAANHNIAGMLLTTDGHHIQAKRIEAQIAAHTTHTQTPLGSHRQIQNRTASRCTPSHWSTYCPTHSTHQQSQKR